MIRLSQGCPWCPSLGSMSLSPLSWIRQQCSTFCICTCWDEVRFKTQLIGSHHNSTLVSRAPKFNIDMILTFIIGHNIYFQLHLNLHLLKRCRGQSTHLFYMQTKHLHKNISSIKVYLHLILNLMEATETIGVFRYRFNWLTFGTYSWTWLRYSVSSWITKTTLPLKIFISHSCCGVSLFVWWFWFFFFL